MELSIVLPCYNEKENIAAAVRDVHGWMARRGMTGEIIVVNDGSKDGSDAVLEGLRAEFGSLRVVTHETNLGYGLAVRSGLDAATTEWVAFMDSDGQFKAEDFELLLPFTTEYSFVTGRRAHRADPFMRNMFGKVLGGMNVIVFGLWVRDVNCAMKIFRRDIWPAIRPTKGVEKLFNTELFLKLKKKGIKWKTVNVPHYPRTKGSPTGGSVRVILRMFKELFKLRFAR